MTSLPLAPPPTLVKQWITEVWHEGTPARLSLSDMHIATEAARWGNNPGSPDSSPQPVPVSERLPGAEDCDAEGRCWWYGEGGDMVGWTLDAEGLSYYRAKYWLPAHALSVPAND